MTKIFFDIETYSPDTTKRPKFDDKIITIAYKTENSDTTVLKEWELGEKEIIKRFTNKILRTDRPCLVGHNILRFDIPVMISRSLENDLGSLNYLMTLFFKSYSIDTIQCLLPANRLNYSGIGLRNCADYLGLEMSGCPGTEIKDNYENENYKTIVHHNIEDVLITEKLHDHILSCLYKPFKD